MKMVSYWKEPREIYEDNGLVLIIGIYDHKNQGKDEFKALGVHWKDYPQSNNTLCPCVIPEETRNAILSGLLHQAVVNQDLDKIQSITEAIRYFR
ncbi:MAG TPA: hypothetical protein DET40_21620 [Lentisphaeria bacterium]|nr:hypothetical protein [Lentisphaeria bacterium]